ncbi:MAG: site-specific DNA-methyltransferase [Methanomassiliicoccaceae archaeon]|nr:site-specific DNA-methyltransferase [Methanomassiliicoccaceae archaeon]
MVGMESDIDDKVSPFTDMINGALFYSALFSKLRGRLETDGAIWTCLNWRSMVSFQKAAFDARLRIASMLVWDKVCIGTGGPAGLRSSYELVALMPMDKFKMVDRGLRDVVTIKWPTTKPTGHPAEKPEALMDFLIEISTRPGDTVLDPFMGSGTVGASALRLGRRYIGMEMDPGWFAYAADRIRGVSQQTVLDPHSLRAWGGGQGVGA